MVAEPADKKMDKSALLVSKLEIDEPDSSNLEKSFEVNNDEPEDKDDNPEAEPIIEDLPLQMPDAQKVVPSDPKVLIEEKQPMEEAKISDSIFAKQLQEEINKEEPAKEQPVEQPPQENPTDLYFGKLIGLKQHTKKYRSCLVQMMDMGFTDFDKNLTLLIASDGNVEHACSQLLQ